MEVGEEGEYIPIATLSTRMTCIKMGSDESHFIVFINCEGQSHKTVILNDDDELMLNVHRNHEAY